MYLFVFVVGDGQYCFDVDECLINYGGCNKTHSTCTNTLGSYVCSCHKGYTGNGSVCLDIDECKTGNGGCHNNSMCTNTEGSRTCQCNSGYSGDGINCMDINECSKMSGGCHKYAKYAFYQQSPYRGGAMGGLGDYIPRRKMLPPVRR